jgi:MFS family permease
MRIRISVAPPDVPPQQKKNFLNVQVDAVGIGLATAAASFLPIFLTRLEATNYQVGLMTSMPALAGLILSIPIGSFLQRRRKIVPWFSVSRLMVVACYAVTGLAGFFIPQQYMVQAVLLIWAFATLPQTILSVAFWVVMNEVAGPTHRYELMSRRWSILGLTTAVTTLLTGQVLDYIPFPLNYQIVFIFLSVGGLVSYYFSSHISIPDLEPPRRESGISVHRQASNYIALVKGQPDFISFLGKRFIFQMGVLLATPLLPLFYVRDLNASNAWIGIFNTLQACMLLLGYFWWPRISRTRGSRAVLLWTTFGLAIYPALVAVSHDVEMVALLTAISSIFQAGIDLVFFDELMKTIPIQYSATFISIAQSAQNLAGVIAPMAGSALATRVGVRLSLGASSLVRFAGFASFARRKKG